MLNLGRVYVTIDTRVSGVKIPSEYQGQHSLTLLLNKNEPEADGCEEDTNEDDDLVLDDESISVTFSFSRVAQHCTIPWSSIWYMTSEEGRESTKGFIFGSSLPEEVRDSIDATPKHLLDFGDNPEEAFLEAETKEILEIAKEMDELYSSIIVGDEEVEDQIKETLEKELTRSRLSVIEGGRGEREKSPVISSPVSTLHLVKAEKKNDVS